MTSYGFTLRFFLPGGYVLRYETESLEISLTENIIITLKSASNSPISKSSELLLIAKGFCSEEEAYSYGHRVKNALILCSSPLQMGINVGKDNIVAGIASFIKKEIEENSGIRLLDKVHGLSVYPVDKPLLTFDMSASGVVTKPVERFIEEFIKAYNLKPEFTDKHLLAFELYMMSHFESSWRARFITLITVIECLAIREKRSQDILDYLNCLLDLSKIDIQDSTKMSIVTKLESLKADLCEDEISYINNLIELTNKIFALPEPKSLDNGLGNLKKESISAACRNLVKLYLGKEKADIFNKCYGIRSDIVHNGKIPENIDNFHKHFLDLDEIVSQILYESVTNTSNL